METMCLRAETYQSEFKVQYPGMPNRLGVCEKESWDDEGLEYGWKEREDRSLRAKNVWIELKRRE